MTQGTSYSGAAKGALTKLGQTFLIPGERQRDPNPRDTTENNNPALPVSHVVTLKCFIFYTSNSKAEYF